MVHFIKFQMNPKFQVIEEILISTFQSDFHSQGYLEDSSGHLAVWEELSYDSEQRELNFLGQSGLMLRSVMATPGPEQVDSYDHHVPPAKSQSIYFSGEIMWFWWPAD